MSREPYILRTDEQRDAIRDLVGKLDMSKPWSVTIEPYRKKRTNSQGALYFKWVGIIARETGNSQDDVHEALKAKFCPPRTVTLGDEERHIRTTTKLTTGEMSAFMDAVHAFAASELAILLPIPEEMHYAA
jgi:hypothetical protein